MALIQKIKRILGLDDEFCSGTEDRIETKEQELTHVMADKIEQEGRSKLRIAEQEQDEVKKREAQEMVTTARAVRRGEVSLLLAMGVVKHERD